MHQSAGGYCDCGDVEAWKTGAWCKLHGGNEDDDEDGDTVASRSVEDKENLEMEAVVSTLSKLPSDLVRRLTFLLKPLINSASVVLFQLLQVSKVTSYYTHLISTVSFRVLMRWRSPL